MKVVTIDSPNAAILYKQTEDIGEGESALAKGIAEELFASLQSYGSVPGLAAPQIGISRSIFIYSYDRDPKNLEVAINPTWVPLEGRQIMRWEGCLSTRLSDGSIKVARVPRYEKIRVTYLNLAGEKQEKELDQLAARIFQHQYDHLRGIENIDCKEAEVRSFPSQEAWLLDVVRSFQKLLVGNHWRGDEDRSDCRGINENVSRKEAEMKSFTSKEAWRDHMQTVKRCDALQPSK